MDGERFDSLVKAISSKRLTRMGALRGMAAGAAAAVAGVAGATLVSEGTAAKRSSVSAKYNPGKRKQICHCVNGDPASCTTIKLRTRGRRKHLRHSCDYPGPCTGRSGCPQPPGPQPIVGCTLDSECPDTLPYCRNRECVECTNNTECPDHETCVDGVCGPECQTSEDCKHKETCVEGVCVPDDECQTSEDCEDHEVCDKGVCVNICKHDRPLFCPGENGKNGKCCPHDDTCDYAPNGAVNCSSDD
jgi:hypothetical protein